MCKRCEERGSELTQAEATRCSEAANAVNDLFMGMKLNVLEVETVLGVVLGDYFIKEPNRLQPWVERLLHYFDAMGGQHAEEAGEAAQARGVH